MEPTDTRNPIAAAADETPDELKVQSTLAFEGGALTIKRSGFPNNGDGTLTFDDDKLDWEHKIDRDGSYRTISLPHSELVAIRDFLNKELPPENHPARDSLVAALRLVAKRAVQGATDLELFGIAGNALANANIAREEG